MMGEPIESTSNRSHSSRLVYIRPKVRGCANASKFKSTVMLTCTADVFGLLYGNEDTKVLATNVIHQERSCFLMSQWKGGDVGLQNRYVEGGGRTLWCKDVLFFKAAFCSGIYNTEYTDYSHRFLYMPPQYGMITFVALLQAMWSYYSGGSGMHGHEWGIPMDLNFWCYNPSNDDKTEDYWNGESFSWFSRKWALALFGCTMNTRHLMLKQSLSKSPQERELENLMTRTRKNLTVIRWMTTELEEGQQIVGVVIDVPKTGQVPPGQVSQDTLYFWHSYRNQSAMTGNGRQRVEGLRQGSHRHEVDEENLLLLPKDVIHRISYVYLNPPDLSNPVALLTIKLGSESLFAGGCWCPGGNKLATIRSSLELYLS
ncbi:hypothetical protein EDD85DRAFT_796168 [Armillaria nabsnona]|nr:hypothetical protein EDD85DRAFT_796168 [Armillaria nabsnona]